MIRPGCGDPGSHPAQCRHQRGEVEKV